MDEVGTEDDEEEMDVDTEEDADVNMTNDEDAGAWRTNAAAYLASRTAKDIVTKILTHQQLTSDETETLESTHGRGMIARIIQEFTIGDLRTISTSPGREQYLSGANQTYDSKNSRAERAFLSSEAMRSTIREMLRPKNLVLQKIVSEPRIIFDDTYSSHYVQRCHILVKEKAKTKRILVEIAKKHIAKDPEQLFDMKQVPSVTRAMTKTGYYQYSGPTISVDRSVNV